MNRSDLRPETRALIEQIEATEPSMRTDEFTLLRQDLFSIQVCTSLTDEQATARANTWPSGTTHGWQLDAEGHPESAPVPCADRPDTHRHLVFLC
jgi:hypothetical protein